MPPKLLEFELLSKKFVNMFLVLLFFAILLARVAALEDSCSSRN